MMCSSCSEEFDEESRSLQILKCSHTLCQLCLKELRQGDVVSCSICETKSESRDLRNATTNERFLGQWNQLEMEIVWCVTCGSPFAGSCFGHRTVQITSQNLHNCREIQEKIDNCRLLISSIVQLRQSIGLHLEEKIKSLHLSADEVKMQLQQLEEKLTSLTSMTVEVDKQLMENKSKLEAASNELQNLNKQPGEQETLKSLEENIEVLDHRWSSDLQDIAQYMQQTDIFQNIENAAPTNVQFESAEVAPSTSNNQTQRVQHKDKMRRQVSAVGREGRHFTSRRQERFHHLTVKDGSSVLGKITIKPFWIIRSNFIMELRNFCHKPQNFQTHISKAVHREYLTLELSSGRFAPRDDRAGSPINSQSGNRVELKRLSTASGDKRTRWQLIFNLGHSSKRGPRLDCLGHVVSGHEFIEYLGRKPLGKSLVITWEYQ